MERCNPTSKNKIKHRVNLVLPQELWDDFKPVLKNHWKGSFTSWVKFAMICYSRDTCEGCPYNEVDSYKFDKKKGIGKKKL